MSAATPSPSPRPSVIQLAIKEKAALYAAYIPLFADGGVFIPTTRDYRLGDDVYVLLSLPDDPQRYPVAGKVAWVTPAARRRQPHPGRGRAVPGRREVPAAQDQDRGDPGQPPRRPNGRRRPSERRRAAPCAACAGALVHHRRMFVDSHCHLSFPELSSRLRRDPCRPWRRPQVDRALCICTTLEEFDDVHALATAPRQLLGHRSACTRTTRACTEPSLDDLLQRAALPRVVAIGETGLDYYRMDERKGGRSVADLEWQRERFRTHIRAARASAASRWSSTPAARIGRHDRDPAGGGRGRLRGQRRRRLPLLHRDRGSGRARRWTWVSTSRSRAS